MAVSVKDDVNINKHKLSLNFMNFVDKNVRQ